MTQTTTSLPPRFPISRDEIEKVVKLFYIRIRAHPVLGPVFFASLPDKAEIWHPHEAKIANFWANAILFERSYSGNPMMVHTRVAAIRPEMFEIWLDLFAETLHQSLPEQTAMAWEALARRIGRGLRMGVETTQHNPANPPLL